MFGFHSGGHTNKRPEGVPVFIRPGDLPPEQPRRVVAHLLIRLIPAAFTLWALYFAITLPIVYTSYESGYCVSVDDVRGVYTCENMPRRYHHAWQP